jgi:hypothetical protein
VFDNFTEELLMEIEAMKIRTELDALLARIAELGPDKPNWLAVGRDCLRMLPQVAALLRQAEAERDAALADREAIAERHTEVSNGPKT